MKITKSLLKTMIKKELNLLNEYEVKPGDSLSKIAKAHGITVSAIIRKNNKFQMSKLSDWKRGDRPGSDDTTSNTSGTRNPNWIYPGENIVIPSGSPRQPANVQRSSDKVIQNPPVPDHTYIADLVGVETAKEYKEECKDDILAILTALISVIDGMKKKVEER